MPQDIATFAPIAPSSEEMFRRALRPLVGQVSVITLLPAGDGPAAQPLGMTLTSATALSTQPAMVIACVNRSASLHGALRLGAVIGWQALGADMQGVAERFSGKDGVRGAARFDGATWQDEAHAGGTARLLQGACLAAAAQIEVMSDHATHSVVIARLLSLHSRPEVGALAYRDGVYLPLPGA